jgi:hypothetical protein
MIDSSGSVTPKKPKKAKKPKAWYQKNKNIIAILTTVISVIAATAAIFQVNEARDQNAAAEQEELLTVVSNLAQVPSMLSQESVTFKSNPAELQNAQSGTDETQLADSEEAVNLISLLHGNGVTADEYYEVAMGLQNNGGDAQALGLLGIAASRAASPRIHADIWRDDAQIYYSLSQASEAGRYIMLAYRAFNGPDISRGSKINNEIYTKLFDAVYQASINCPTAREEVSFAEGLIKNNQGSQGAGVLAQEIRTNAAIARCPEATGKLTRNVPAQKPHVS